MATRSLVRASLQRSGVIGEGRGAYRRGQIDAAEFQRGKRGTGFSKNPQADYGPDDICYLDSRGNRREWPNESRVRRSNADAAFRETIPSRARARRSSAVEDNEGYQYGGPARRME